MRTRKPLLLTLIALGIALASTAAVVLLWPASYETDGTTVAAHPALDDTGPDPGTFRQVWERTVVRPENGDPLRSLQQIGAGHLLEVGADKLRGYDARTGKPSWRYAQPGRTLTDATVAQGGVIARFGDRSGDLDTIQLVGLDPRTGAQRWTRNEPWAISRGSSDSGVGQPDPTASVVTFETRAGVTGLNAATGDEAWTLTNGELTALACDGGFSKPDREPDALIILESKCSASKSRYLAVDADSGEPVWAHAGETAWTAEGFTALAEPIPGKERKTGESRLRLLDRDGEEVYQANTSTCAQCTLLGDQERMVLVHDDPAELRVPKVVLVDSATGEITEVSVPPGWPHGRPVSTGDRLYYAVQERHHQRTTGPLYALVVVDLGSGQVRTSPLPLPGDDLYMASRGFAAPALASPRILSTADRQLLITGKRPHHGNSGDSRVERVLGAYEQLDTAEPVELGGVRPEDWPRACDLLRKTSDRLADGQPSEQHGGEAGPPRVVNGSEIPESGCTAPLPSIGETRLFVHWVTATAEEAEALMPEPVVEDEDRRLVRLGRVILTIDAEFSANDSERIITSLRKALPAELAEGAS